MKSQTKIILFLLICMSMASCSKKQIAALQTELELANKDLAKCGEDLGRFANKLSACEKENQRLKAEVEGVKGNLEVREEQLEDLKTQRDKTVEQVGDLTVLSREANQNIKETLQQLENKDKYIHLLHAAKSRADSINLALAINLKSVLRQGIADQDVEIQVDKTVVFVNLSDKMLFESGSSTLTERAHEVLGKIAKIVESRPELEVMVEGYTDSVPIKNSCMEDNWDLSVIRATSVVRVLQRNYNVDPNRLIAAGRGEYNALASNAFEDGRAMNRRTRIIILPKLNQFYDLLNPNKVPK